MDYEFLISDIKPLKINAKKQPGHTFSLAKQPRPLRLHSCIFKHEAHILLDRNNNIVRTKLRISSDQKGRMTTVYGCAVPAGGQTRYEFCGASGMLASIKYSKSEEVTDDGNVRV